jgi:hypothetical protein
LRWYHRSSHDECVGAAIRLQSIWIFFNKKKMEAGVFLGSGRGTRMRVGYYLGVAVVYPPPRSTPSASTRSCTSGSRLRSVGARLRSITTHTGHDTPLGSPVWFYQRMERLATRSMAEGVNLRWIGATTMKSGGVRGAQWRKLCRKRRLVEKEIKNHLQTSCLRSRSKKQEYSAPHRSSGPATWALES